MKPDEESAYERGYAQAMRSVMADASRALGREVDAPQDAALLAEIHDARNALRDLCREHGLSNDWGDDLHLCDVVEKHVGRSLSRGPQRSGPRWNIKVTEREPEQTSALPVPKSVRVVEVAGGNDHVSATFIGNPAEISALTLSLHRLQDRSGR